MRARALRAAAVTACLGAALVACVDLFHSTSFETLCDVDAAACAPVVEASAPVVDAGTDAASFCAWDSPTARVTALRACAWLGACAGPVGDDAFGPCVVNATLAYDCATNPNRQVTGPAYAFWAALARAASCTDVFDAVFPKNEVPQCSASSTAYAGCLDDAVLACGDAGSSSPSGYEGCVGLGQTCATSGLAGACAGASALCPSGGTGTSCVGSQLHDCDPDASPFDRGVDCASFGKGECVQGYPSAACVATGGVTCTRSASVTCDGQVAIGCPSGIQEQVDCDALLGSATGATCDPDAGGPSWEVSRACSVGTCVPDSCGGNPPSIVSGCARGAYFAQDCTALGFSGCALVTVPNDPTPHAACVP